MFEDIRLVEIEVHNYCNRTCKWCPNSFIDRKKEYFALDEEAYENILRELARENYDGAIAYSRYNEPFSSIKNLKQRAALAREILPQVKLVTNTNGDYLTAANLDGLSLDEISIMDYDNKGIEWCTQKLIEAGATITKSEYPHVFAERNGVKLLYYVDWPKNHIAVVDRGGSLDIGEKKERKWGCMEPTHFVGVDFNGSVVPCCNIRSDFEKHKDYVLGNINDQTLEEIYYGEKATKFRTDVAAGRLYEPCRYCHKNPGRYTREDSPGIEYIEGIEYAK